MPELVIIFTGIILLAVVIGFSINALVGKVLAHKRWEREHSLIGSKSAAKASGVADRTDLIEDRLRVLERLATDRGTLLSDEIDALRSERREREGA